MILKYALSGFLLELLSSGLVATVVHVMYASAATIAHLVIEAVLASGRNVA